jgi:hypothetical protein
VESDFLIYPARMENTLESGEVESVEGVFVPSMLSSDLVLGVYYTKSGELIDFKIEENGIREGD